MSPYSSINAVLINTEMQLGHWDIWFSWCSLCIVIQSFSHFLFTFQGIVCMYAQSLLSFLTLCDPMDAPVFKGFSRQEYQSELPCLPPGDLPDPRIEPAFPASPAWQADSLLLSHHPSAQNSHKEALNHLVLFYSNNTAQRIPGFHGHPPGTEDPTDPESPSPFQVAWNLGLSWYWAWSLIEYSSLE